MAFLFWTTIACTWNAPVPASVADIHRDLLILTQVRLPSMEQLGRRDKLVAALAARHAEDACTLYWQAVSLDRDNKPDEAAAMLMKAVGASSELDATSQEALRADAWTLLGTIHLAMDEPSRAMADAKRAIALDATRPEPYRLLMDASFADGDLAAAEPALAEAARRSPDSASIREMHFELLSQLGKLNTLRDEIREQLARDPVCSVANYFAATLLSTQSLERELRLIIAAINGSPRSESTLKALNLLAPTHDDAGNTPGREILDLLGRCEARLSRGLPLEPDELQRVRKLLDGWKPPTPLGQLLNHHFQSTLQFIHGETIEPRKTWEAMAEDFPRFVPALCRLAEIDLAMNTEASRALAFKRLDLARTIRPTHPLVREHDRLGITLGLHDRGVVLFSVDSSSPLSIAGLRAGDILTAINGQSLAKGGPLDRLRRARLFGGGQLTFLANSIESSVEVPILLFD